MDTQVVYSLIAMLGPIEMFVGLRRFGASASHPKNGELFLRQFANLLRS